MLVPRRHQQASQEARGDARVFRAADTSPPAPAPLSLACPMLAGTDELT